MSPLHIALIHWEVEKLWEINIEPSFGPVSALETISDRNIWLSIFWQFIFLSVGLIAGEI